VQSDPRESGGKKRNAERISDSVRSITNILFTPSAAKRHPSLVPPAPRIRRPKSDGRCIHCQEPLAKPTKDHVFPSSWYPDTTPKGLERWTAPSCGRCNQELGRLEKDLLVFFACCMDPTKPATRGLYQRVRRTMGLGVSGLSDAEMLHRAARRRKLLDEAQPYSSDMLPHIIPGLGPYPEAPASLKRQLTVKVESVHAVIRKIVRGCEYWLAGGRIVEPPYEITIIFPTETPEFVNQVMAAFAMGPVHLGPGLRIRRGEAHDAPLSALYELVMWERITVYAIIFPPEAEQTSRGIAHEEVALHAYYHWERRGRPLGSPEVDWYWAIEDLRGA
jgi:hypothetical protein